MLGSAICLANRRDGVWNKNAPVASPQSDTLRATGFFFVLRMKRGREGAGERDGEVLGEDLQWGSPADSGVVGECRRTN